MLLGIAAFDARELLLSLSQSEKEKLIETVQVFCSRDKVLSMGGNGKLFVPCSFGPTLEAMAYEWDKLLMSTKNTIDDQDQYGGKLRKIFLVGRGIRHDLAILLDHGFNPLKIQSVVGLADTRE